MGIESCSPSLRRKKLETILVGKAENYITAEQIDKVKNKKASKDNITSAKIGRKPVKTL